MRTLNLGVILDQSVSGSGGYQQSLNAALLTLRLSQNVNTIFLTTVPENVSALAIKGIKAEVINFNFLEKIHTYTKRIIENPFYLKLLKKILRLTPFEKKLRDKNVDLVYFVSPSNWAIDCVEINYITTVWDLCHRDDPEFPEVRSNYQIEDREKAYKRILHRAVAIIADSKLGKKNIIKRYGIDSDRVYVIPFEGAISIERSKENKRKITGNIIDKYNLNVPYIFYPAQFWAHKNHAYILEGLRLLEKKYGIDIGAIFSGGDKGNLTYIKKLTNKLNLENKIRFIGYVDDDEIPEIYSQSVALVMPTFFGPTNIPPLEAFKLGVPVLYSNKPGLIDQVKDAALLLDLKDPLSMANHIKRLIEEPQLRGELIEKGKRKLEEINKVDRVKILNKVILEYIAKRNTWSK